MFFRKIETVNSVIRLESKVYVKDVSIFFVFFEIFTMFKRMDGCF